MGLNGVAPLVLILKGVKEGVLVEIAHGFGGSQGEPGVSGPGKGAGGGGDPNLGGDTENA